MHLKSNPLIAGVEKKHPRSSDLAHITDSGESIGKVITFNRHASGRPSGNISSLNTSQFPHVASLSDSGIFYFAPFQIDFYAQLLLCFVFIRPSHQKSLYW